MTEAEIRRAQLLDWLYDYKPESPGMVPDAADFLGTEQVQDPHVADMWRSVLRQLQLEGLIMLYEAMGFEGTSFDINEAGRMEVEQRRARRADPVGRNAAARDGIVKFLYGRPGYEASSVEAMTSTPTFYFEGQPLSSNDLEEALRYLFDAELISGTKMMGNQVARPKLTKKGIDCAEQFGGSVTSYLRRDDGRGGSTHNVHFNGNVSGNVAWASETVTQTATTTSTGLAGDELAMLVNAIREAAPVLGLADEDASTLTRNLDVVDGELVSDQPDADVVKKFMQRALGTVGKAAGSTLSLVLTAYAKHLMQKAGIPID